MGSYREQDPRVVFMSTFPMYQAKLFENQNTRDGKRSYGGSQHYHYVVPPSEPVTYNGSKMVHSSVLEMISHIVLATAVGGKAAFLEKVAATPDIGHQTSAVRRTLELCTDCPASLLPFHVKPVPEPVCKRITSLPSNASTGEVWNNEICPDWCMTTEPVDQTPTESGLVDVRICDVKGGE
ncbi:unnamed protein product [Ascophyllum nodosum]